MYTLEVKSKPPIEKNNLLLKVVCLLRFSDLVMFLIFYYKLYPSFLKHQSTAPDLLSAIEPLLALHLHLLNTILI